MLMLMSEELASNIQGEIAHIIALLNSALMRVFSCWANT